MYYKFTTYYWTMVSIMLLRYISSQAVTRLKPIYIRLYLCAYLCLASSRHSCARHCRRDIAAGCHSAGGWGCTGARPGTCTSSRCTESGQSWAAALCTTRNRDTDLQYDLGIYYVDTHIWMGSICDNKRLLNYMYSLSPHLDRGAITHCVRPQLVYIQN